MRSRGKSTARRPQQPELLPPPRPFDASDGWRRTFLHHVTKPLEQDALIRLTRMLDRLVLEEGSFWDELAESSTRAELRAAAEDLFFLYAFLAKLGREPENVALDAADTKLAKLAARMAPKVGRLAVALEGALAPPEVQL